MSAWRVNGPLLTNPAVIRRKMEGERLTLAIWGHNGLGDHIICQGIYRTLAEDWDIKLLVTENVAMNVRLMLMDAPQITVVPLRTEQECDQYCKGITNEVILKLGVLAGDGFVKSKFDQEFYRQALVPFEYRWTKFKCPDVPQIPVPQGRYIFIHERPDFNNARLNMKGFRPVAGQSIFAHRDVILHAAELHCVSSAFAAFADSLPLNGQTLHFYHYGREIPAHKQPWTIHAHQ